MSVVFAGAARMTAWGALRLERTLSGGIVMR